jgi:methylated-DNA-[protein]-cysteine S-methyltransferase
MSKIIGCEIKTPWVPMSVLVDVENKPIVVGAAFLPMTKFLRKAGRKLNIADYKKDTKLAGVTQVVNNWIDGDLNAFSQLKVRQPGGEFMQECWKELRKVKGGKVVSYAQLAKSAGRPLAVRAAGTACSSNLIAPIIPCHRVVKTGGQLGNYGFGSPLKAALLKHEGVEI